MASPFSDPSSDGGHSPKPTFVSSPLNPNPSNTLDASTVSSHGGSRPSQRRSAGNSSVGTEPPSRNNSLMLGGSERSAGSDSSAGSGSSSDPQMQEIVTGAIGSAFSPYPNFANPSVAAANNANGTTATQADFRRPSLSSNSHARFSTISSGSSIIGFSSDSKYAMPFLSYHTLPKDPHSVFHQSAMYGLYDRLGGPEDEDDFIHEPGAKNLKVQGTSWRGAANVFVLIALCAALIILFAGYPIISWATKPHNALWQQVPTNATGQIPDLFGLPTLVDPASPADAQTRKGFDGEDYVLVFSDEFETPGRSFYPGDDPFWEAVNLWYHATTDLEWYDPGQITTRDGALRIVIEETDEYPGLPWKSGMLQSWNKFCFTTGYVEVAVTFPGTPQAAGYWPGAWFMGNLGRPGYGATSDGVWPYTYDSCDVGTVPNQTINGVPDVSQGGGNPKYNNNLSWMPGQRLSACTCPNEDHPGPFNGGRYTGRGAPEIDIFEAQRNKDTGVGGRVSQSLQVAPFNYLYYGPNTTNDIDLYNADRTKANTYRGSALQQAISVYTTFNDTTYAQGGDQFTKFGVEYWSDPSSRADGFVTFVVGDNYPSYHVASTALAGDTLSGIQQRLITEEPMSLVLNLAISKSFQTVDLTTLTFPNEYSIDYVRVYQRQSVAGSPETHLSCSPPAYPTEDYINRHPEAYQNPNVSSWADTGNSMPKNSKLAAC